MEPKVVILLILSMIVVLLLVGARLKALRFIGYGAIRLVIGALALFVINAIGGNFSVHIPINLVTSFICGFLGVPGAAALIIIDKYIVM
ncbi:pro-sigmaK processing inhibitor BofA family protein [Saccharococcus caldoxylosilyticus]|uniref:Sigma-K factor-processing regulatory protein BofA n=1 Tax=Parageobacillus caldoxylosilyticus NBRC 107762 TaxID=1220594 RepID=A0A023DK08_9BACL|nr:pro-sigmaK processing inhibitor BofA family protein [Parageobacillus caldoxylosilyticus]OQP00650.1 pro-sigmaK processing inhibitor BofA [Geobacillus sp. 44B]MBB3854498.1 inhibitor of the pro-sigma K processing machinery [Parageobacillus caldoxylosilyticus]QNU38665.1 pro-sigmaK processing inhibitor BofA family protein [Geobacillus sp. 44B]QXJ38419.1 Sigma-K factor-processing regulatory protein BofA [Parageobacillus caldoxylosilyticus]BDG34116.1 sigma-K factor-processing regulatory protein Bo